MPDASPADLAALQLAAPALWLQPARVAPLRSLACQRRHSRASPPQAADDISRKQEALNVLERIEGKLVSERLEA